MLRWWYLTLVFVVLLLAGCVSFDLEPPSVEAEFLAPPPRLAGETVTISISVSDDTGVASVVVKNGDVVLWSAEPGRRKAELKASFPAPYGSVELAVEAKDRLGKTSSVTLRRFTTLDGTPPQVLFTVSPSSPKPGDTVTVSVEATDNESGVESVEVNVSGSKYVLTNAKGDVSFTVRAGVYNISATARDRAGNVGNAPEKSIKVFDPDDNTPPNVSLIYPSAVIPGGEFTLTVVATDAGGIEKVDLSGDLGSQSVRFDSGPTSIERTFSFVAGSYGTRNFKVVVQDLAGNTSRSDGSITVKDNTLPSVELSVPEGRILEGDLVTLEATASDENGIDRVVFEVDDDVIATVNDPPYKAEWVAESGEHTVKAVAYDVYGATSSAVRTLNVQKVDTTGPVILFSPMDVYPVDTESTLYARIYDEESPVVDVSFNASGEELPVSSVGDSLYSANWVPDEVGTYTITVSATNDQGFNSKSVKSVEVLPQDIANAPRFKELVVYPQLAVEGDTVHITGKVESTSRLESCNLYVDDVLRGSTTTSNGRFDFSWTAVGLGEHEIKLSAVNTLGLSAEATRQVTVYAKRPVATITSPDMGERFRKIPDLKVELVAQVNDSNEPSEYWFSVTGPQDFPKIVPEMSGAGPYVFQATFQPEEIGYYTISFFYKNSVGLSTIATTTMRVYQLELTLEEPVSYEHIEFGYDVPVKLDTSVDVEVSTLTVIDANTNETTYRTPLTLTSTDLSGNVYTTTLPASALPHVGPYIFRVRGATIEGDEQTEDFPRNVRDTIPPTFTVSISSTPVSAGSYHKLLAFNDYTLNVSASDLASIDEIYVNVGGNATTVEGGIAAVTINLAKAVYPTRINVVDGNGLSSSLDFTLEGIERHPPYLTLSRFVFTPSATVFGVGETVNVDAQSVEATDDTAIASIALFANDQPIAVWRPSLPGEEIHAVLNHVQGPWTPYLVGDYTISLKCFDVYGNVSAISTVVHVADLSEPLVHVIPQTDRYVDDYPVLDGRMDVKVSYSDPLFAFEEAAVYLDGTLLAYSDSVSGNEHTFRYIDFSGYSDGFHTLSAIATNSVGTSGRDETVVIVDNDAPVGVEYTITGVATYLVSGTSSTPVVSGVYSVRATPTGVDLPSDVRNLTFSFDGEPRQSFGKETAPPYVAVFDPADSPDGVHTVEISFTDMAKNVVTRSFTVLQDTSGPVVHWNDSTGFNRVGDSVYSNRAEINVRVSDELTDVHSVNARVTSSGWGYELYLGLTKVAADTYRLSYGGVDGIVENRVYQITLENEDAAGNISKEPFQLVYDTNSPTISITSPSSGEVFNTDFSVNVHLSDNLAGLDEYRLVTSRPFATSAVLNGVMDADESIPIHLIPSTETTVVISAYASDLAMNVSSQTIVVRNDPLAPRLDLQVEPLNDAGYASTSTLSVMATAVDRWHGEVKLWLDTTPYPLSTDSVVVATDVDFTGVSDGFHTVKLEAVDEAGNSAQKIVTATVDTVQPELYATWTPTAYASNTISLTYTATDVNFDKVRFDWEDGYYDFSTTSVSGEVRNFASEGTKTITVTAWDLAGNATTVSGTLVVDQTPPVERGMWINGTELTGDSAQGSVTFSASLLFSEPHFDLGSTPTLVSVSYDTVSPVTDGTPITFTVSSSGTDYLLEASHTFSSTGIYYVKFSVKDLAYNEYEKTIEYTATPTSP